MNEANVKYQSYLVRLWQDSPQAPWRATAQCIQTHTINHFADMDALVNFLWTQTTPRPPHPSPPLLRAAAVGWTEDESSSVQPTVPSLFGFDVSSAEQEG